MTDETFPDADRIRLKELVVAAIPRNHGDPQLTAILARLNGTDTVLIARRAYPSRATEQRHA